MFYRSTKQKVVVLCGLAFFSLGVVGVFLNWNAQQLNQVIENASQANQVSERLQKLLSELQDGETGQRGYLLTGRIEYLEPYDNGTRTIGDNFKQIRSLLQSDPSQSKRLDQVERLIDSKRSELIQTIELRRIKGFAAALNVVKSDRGKSDMDAIRNLIQEMQLATQNNLTRKDAEAKAQANLVIMISVGSSFLALTVGLLGSITILADLDRRIRLEADLRDSNDRFHLFMNNSPVAAFMKDKSGRYTYINHTLEDALAVKLADFKGSIDEDWVSPEKAKEFREADQLVLASQKVQHIVETIAMPDGKHNHWLTVKFPMTDSYGHQFVGGISIEITERIHLEQELFKEKELSQVTLNSIGDAVVTTDAAGNVMTLNPIAEALTGWNHTEAKGQPFTKVLHMVNETSRDIVKNPIEEALQTEKIVELANHTILIARDGTETPISDSAAPIRAKSGEILGAVMVFRDVSATYLLNQQLSWQASHDVLTNLFNRLEFENRLDQILAAAKRDHQCHALCYLDLDQFKIVNDTCGHFAGDQLLRQVTDLLTSHIRKTDVLARLGGDEFGLLLDYCSLEQAQSIANILCEKVKALRFVCQDKVFTIGVSIGLVEINKNTESVAALLSMADTACYAAKNNGRNRVHTYCIDDESIVQQQGEMQWVGRITQALEENRFCLYHQPIVSLQPTQSKGEHYEVLLRLQENGQLIPPMAFIPAAERYNVMNLVDRWVIKTLFADQGEHYRNVWDDYQSNGCDMNSCGDYLYAINLSGASLNDSQFVEFLYAQFTEHRIPPQIICFEITETVAITNLTQAAKFITEMREIGCRFSLDDFGSGMSSFSYLKNLPIDFLKIDGSFIKTMAEDPVSLVIVESIRDIGRAMGIQVIAEFVESDDVLHKLTTMGINYAQGYGVGMPTLLCKKNMPLSLPPAHK